MTCAPQPLPPSSHLSWCTDIFISFPNAERWITWISYWGKVPLCMRLSWPPCPCVFVCVFCRVPSPAEWSSTPVLHSLQPNSRPCAMTVLRSMGGLTQPRRPVLGLCLSSSPLCLLIMILLTSPWSTMCGPPGTVSLKEVRLPAFLVKVLAHWFKNANGLPLGKIMFAF